MVQIYYICQIHSHVSQSRVCAARFDCSFVGNGGGNRLFQNFLSRCFGPVQFTRLFDYGADFENGLRSSFFPQSFSICCALAIFVQFYFYVSLLLFFFCSLS